MGNESITINAGNAKYLNQIPGFKDLPSRCLFNKVLTGCGGTSVALENNIPYVIAMPYTELIKSKMKWCNEKGVNAIPVYSGSGFQEEDVAGAKKIMVTYDSLPKVVKTLGPEVKSYKLLVDEYHLLTKSGDFRYDAVNNLLKNFHLFGDYVFMSATPIKRKYLPSAIEHLSEVQVQWKNITPVTLDYTILDKESLYPAVSGIAYKYFTGEFEGNCYIYINSINSIAKIVRNLKKAGVTQDDIRIICADNTLNRDKLDKGIGRVFQIESVTDLPKKINFLTAKAFEGADILDETGVSYIVTDGSKDHTKYDIMTTIPQIIGRIRDSEHKNWAKIIFSPSEFFSYTSEKEFSKYVTNSLKEAAEVVFTYQASNNFIIKSALRNEAGCNPYLVVSQTGEIEVNDAAWKAQMSCFDALHTTYYVKKDRQGKIVQKESNSQKTINHVPYDFKSTPDKDLVLTRLESVELGLEKPNFADYCEIYREIRPFNSDATFEFYIPSVADERKLELIERQYPMIIEAFDILGYDKMKVLEFNQRDIKAELLKRKELSQAYKVRELLDPYKYKVGRRIPLTEIKKDIQEVFDLLGINRTAKAVDLNSIFAVKEIRMKGGDRSKAYKIIAPK